MNLAPDDTIHSLQPSTAVRRRAIIFEGEGGIGSAAGVALARSGAEVGLIGFDGDQLFRVATRLKEAGARGVATSVFDTSIVASLDTALPHLIRELEGLDTMIWVIGFDRPLSEYGIASYDPEVLDRMLDSQFRALVHAVHHCLDSLTQSADGKIIIVGGSEPQERGCYTTLGIQHAVQHFADSLFEEIEETGVKITFVKTGQVAMPTEEDLEQYTNSSRMIRFEDMTGVFAYLLNSPPSVCTTEITLKPSATPTDRSGS